MQARYYDAILGRLLSTDPIGYQDQLNLYAYVHNDPVNHVDPTGMCTGSRITTEDGTRAITGGFNTGTSGVAQGMQIDRAIGKAISDAGNHPSQQNDNTSSSRATFRSNEALRLTAPGQVSYDNAVESYMNEEYGDAAIYGAAMLAEQALTVATLGQGKAIDSGIRVGLSAAGRSLGPAGPIIGPQRLGGSSVFQINNNPYFRFGSGYRASTNNQVLRFGGDWLQRVTGRSHFDLPITAPIPPGH